MPIDETQPSTPQGEQPIDPLAETDKHIPQGDETQASKLAETRPNNVQKPAKPSGGSPRKPSKLRRLLLWTGAFIGGLILLVAISAWVGYSKGNGEYSSQATLEMGSYIITQYQLASDDFEAGNYLLARDRLLYIVDKDPEHTAAIDLLVRLQVILNMTATPPPATPTITQTATPDLRPAEELYEAAVAMISLSEWDFALETLSNLRKYNPSYRIVEVDGLMFLALRNRGVDKILNFGELEGGIYDFSLAENFGPLDGEAENYRTWARMYLLGNAFWGAYPEQAAYYYGQVVGAGVNITDASGVSAFYRYWASLAQMGDFSAAEGDWCLASEQYQIAMDSWALDQLVPTATYAFEACLALTPSATPTSSMTATLDPLTETAQASITPSATQSVGGTPTFTPTNTPIYTPTDTQEAVADTDTPTPTATPTPIPTDTQEAAP
jgi:hypothetical protein